MTLQATLGETVQLHFLAFHADRVSPYIGLSNSDFFKSLVINDTEVTDITVTVEEVESTGKYVIAFTPNETGFWWVSVRLNNTNDWFGEPVRVRD